MRVSTLAYAAISAALLWYLTRRLTYGATAFSIPGMPNFPDTSVPSVGIKASTLAFLRQREGLRLTAYPDAGGYSIGFGHFLGSKPEPASITQQQAETWLNEDANKAGITIARFVRVPLTQNQYDALISFVYNVGEGAFANSTLLQKLNAGDITGAAAEFNRWVYSQGQVLPALTDRRALEKSLFVA